MPKLSRKDDKNTTGGKILKGAESVFAVGKPVGLHVSEISPHKPKPKEKPHKSAKTTEGSPTVFVEGKPVLYLGSGNDCKHKIVEGADTVFVEGN
jgi:uncharacterized Zn-binding protein involved in type VI secretion|tara:strand:- start:5609 stop:5893 length:285 start_codon:yes stop_codon:yes gene_type:complete